MKDEVAFNFESNNEPEMQHKGKCVSIDCQKIVKSKEKKQREKLGMPLENT